MLVTDDSDRELPNDKGQTCTACGTSFKYQYLYDDHWPCSAARAARSSQVRASAYEVEDPKTHAVDPTTASIAARNAEHDQLHAEITRLRCVIGERRAEVEASKAARERAEDARDAALRSRDHAERERNAARAEFEVVKTERDRLAAAIAAAKLAETVEVFVLLADGDGTMRSSDSPFGIAVTTEEEAKRFVREGGVGYTHSYVRVLVFADKDAGVRQAYPQYKSRKESP